MNNPEVPTNPRPFVKEFKVPEQDLSPENKRTFDILKRATVSFADVFALQSEIGFYPRGISPEKLKEAAEHDPKIMSPYTVVVEEDDKLTPVPYTIAYAGALGQPIKLLLEAAQTISDPKEKKYLEARAYALLSGDYEVAEKAWQDMDEEPTVDIAISYYEKYMDDLMGWKYAAMSWVGIKDQQKTDIGQQICDKYIGARGWQGSKIRIRVDNTAVFSGFITVPESIPGATSLPNQRLWRERNGTKIILFEQPFKEFLGKQIPRLRNLYEDAESYTDDEIETMAFKLLSAHESFHPVIRYEEDEERLGREFTYINELLPDLLARKYSADLVGDLVSEKELKLSIPMVASRALTMLEERASEKNISFSEAMDQSRSNPYVQGWATILNYLAENGGISISNGKINLISEEKILSGVEKLSEDLENIAKNGTDEDVKELKSKYADINMFNSLRSDSSN